MPTTAFIFSVWMFFLSWLAGSANGVAASAIAIVISMVVLGYDLRKNNR